MHVTFLVPLLYLVRFQILTATSMKMSVFWDALLHPRRWSSASSVWIEFHEIFDAVWFMWICVNLFNESCMSKTV
jgi:hypothetical protein